jgi:hypothetical protein
MKVTIVFNYAECGTVAVFKTKKAAIQYLKNKGCKKRKGDDGWCYGEEDPLNIDFYIETRRVRE